MAFNIDEVSKETMLSGVLLRMYDGAKAPQGCPRIEWQDLVAVPVLIVDNGNVYIEHPITYSDLDKKGITERELIDAAKFKIRRHTRIGLVGEFIAESIAEEYGKDAARDFLETAPHAEVEIFVLKCGSKFGATAVLDEKNLDAVSLRLGGDFHLIPSSIHEFLAVSTDLSPARLMEIVQDINNSDVVGDDDILSYNIYSYDHQTMTVHTADLTQKPPEKGGKNLAR